MSEFSQTQNVDDNSQTDLFNGPVVDVRSRMDVPATLTQILDELKALRKDVAEVKILAASKPQILDIERSSYKKTLIGLLKSKFSIWPWLDVTDQDFKKKATTLLVNEGYSSDDVAAMKIVVAFATTRFTDYRNQLRRKIILEVNKSLIKTGTLREMCRVLLGSYCPLGEDICSEGRVQNALMIRAYIHKYKYLEHHSFEWGKAKGCMAQVKAIGDEGKWGELKETDKRRMLRHINET